MTALEPCPFCGASSVAMCITTFGSEDRPAFAVSCRTRSCHGAIFSLGYGLFETREQAVAAWNARAPDHVGDVTDKVDALTPEYLPALVHGVMNIARAAYEETKIKFNAGECAAEQLEAVRLKLEELEHMTTSIAANRNSVLDPR